MAKITDPTTKISCYDKGRKLSVLVVEDDEVLAKMMSGNLPKRCANIDVRYTGETALDAVLARDYDAIVLDVKLPDMTGIEILRVIRGGGKARGDPAIIMITASGDEYASEALNEGADGYITKPFSLADLSTMVLDRVQKRSVISSNCNFSGKLYRVERALVVANKSIAEAGKRASEIVDTGKANGKALDAYLEEHGKHASTV